MLSAAQIQILSQLDALNASSLTTSDQQPQVSAISELIQQLNDLAEYEQLIAPSTQQNPLKTFVLLCQRRLVSAQAQSLANYASKRALITAKTVPPPDASVTDAKPFISETYTGSDLGENLQIAKSEDISQVLQRMHDMAQQEVVKSELNISELDMSSRTLRELQEKYSGVDLLLNASKQLVKVINEADAWERRYMLASMGFLALVMAYIVYRRILSGPVKLLLWGFLKLFGLAKFFANSVPSGENLDSSLTRLPPVAVSATTALASVLVTSAIVSGSAPINPPIIPRIGGVKQHITFKPQAAPPVTTTSRTVRGEL